MVRLRAIAAADAPAIASAVDRSRDALRRWMAWYRDDYDVHSAQAWIASTLASGTAIQFAIVSGEDLVGVIGFEDIDKEPGRAMLGYWIATDAAGQGIGRRAVALALSWARTRPGLRTVWALVADGNLASRRVLEMNEFRPVGSRGVDERGDVALLYELELHAPAA